jgi:cell division septum initiation protein DivIVA
VTSTIPRTGHSFGRQLGGYRRARVDAFIDQTAATLDTLRAELAVTVENDPLTHIGGEVAQLLRTVAEAVASMHDNAEHQAAAAAVAAEERAQAIHRNAEEEALRLTTEADAVRRIAEEEALRLTTEAGALFAATQKARSDAEQHAQAIVERAEETAAGLVERQLAAAKARFGAIDAQRELSEQQVARAAEHLATVLSALQSLRGLGQGLGQGQSSSPFPSALPSGRPEGALGAVAEGTQTGPSPAGDHVAEPSSALAWVTQPS